MNILGIDIGGSALKAAPVNTTTGQLLAERHRIATPEKLTPKQMAAAVRKLARHFNWTGPVGIGFPGVIHGSTIMTSANLHKDFIGCDAGKLFVKATGLPVSIVNDADAAGLAEVDFGAGKNFHGTLLLLTFGTGIGSALFVDGKLYPNSEFGHLRFKGGDAEWKISAAAKERRGLSYKKWAREVSRYLDELGAVLYPQLVIIGGGISADHEKWFKHLKTKLHVVPASFLNEAGIVGAALCAKK